MIKEEIYLATSDWNLWNAIEMADCICSVIRFKKRFQLSSLHLSVHQRLACINHILLG